MKQRIMLFMSLCALALVSCGGKSKTVTVRDVDLYGSIGDVRTKEVKNVTKKYPNIKAVDNISFEIKDGEYKFMLKDNKLTVDVPITTIKATPNGSLDEIDDFYLSIIDCNEDNIEDAKGDDIDLELENKEVVNKLLKSKAGDVNILKFYYLLDDPTALDKIKSFEVRIDIYLNDDNEDNANDDSYSSSTSSENWDAVLDSYESYIDQYIALYKKAQAGDMSAMSEYATFMEKAAELSEKLSNAKSDMSSAQMSRFVKLQAKLTAGMMQ